MNTYTTLDQSKRLVELGIKPTTADGVYAAKIRDWSGKEISDPRYRLQVSSFPGKFVVQNFEEIDEIPAWSFGNLLNQLPGSITVDNFSYDLVYIPSTKTISYVLEETNHALVSFFVDSDPYENIISCIDWLINTVGDNINGD